MNFSFPTVAEWVELVAALDRDPTGSLVLVLLAGLALAAFAVWKWTPAAKSPSRRDTP